MLLQSVTPVSSDLNRIDRFMAGVFITIFAAFAAATGILREVKETYNNEEEISAVPSLCNA